MYLGAHVNNQFFMLLPLQNCSLPRHLVFNCIAALATTAGTAADPGVTKVALDAELTKLANNVATIAVRS
jgi:hypothetical protein